MDLPGVEPGSTVCRTVVFPLDHKPVKKCKYTDSSDYASMERRGLEPRFSGCKPEVFPLDQRPNTRAALTRCIVDYSPSLIGNNPRFSGGQRYRAGMELLGSRRWEKKLFQLCLHEEPIRISTRVPK